MVGGGAPLVTAWRCTLLELARLIFMRDLLVYASQIRPGDGLMRAGFVLAVVAAVRRVRGRVELRLTSGLPFDLFDTDQMTVRRWEAAPTKKR
jgi:hypothetical protein